MQRAVAAVTSQEGEGPPRVTPFYDTSRTKKKTLCLILIEMFSTMEWTKK